MLNFQDNGSRDCVFIFARHFNAMPTSHIALYLGNAGLELNTPFINLDINELLLRSMFDTVLSKVLIEDLAIQIAL